MFKSFGDEPTKAANATDLAFVLSRQELKDKLGWSVFNQKKSSTNPEVTSFGFMPIILAPAHKLDMLNTHVVKQCMAISAHFNQEYTVITVDKALYPKLMELKWCIPEYQNKLFPRLGGLHISINFLKAIGEHMNGSRLKDVWLESNLLSLFSQEKLTTKE